VNYHHCGLRVPMGRRNISGHPYFYKSCTIDSDALPDLVNFMDQLLGNINEINFFVGCRFNSHILYWIKA
jgi:hypothetical protein